MSGWSWNHFCFLLYISGMLTKCSGAFDKEAFDFGEGIGTVDGLDAWGIGTAVTVEQLDPGHVDGDFTLGLILHFSLCFD